VQISERELVLMRTVFFFFYSVIALGHHQHATEQGQRSHPKQIKTEKGEKIGNMVSIKKSN